MFRQKKIWSKVVIFGPKETKRTMKTAIKKMKIFKYFGSIQISGVFYTFSIFCRKMEKNFSVFNKILKNDSLIELWLNTDNFRKKDPTYQKLIIFVKETCFCYQ